MNYYSKNQFPKRAISLFEGKKHKECFSQEVIMLVGGLPAIGFYDYEQAKWFIYEMESIDPNEDGDFVWVYMPKIIREKIESQIEKSGISETTINFIKTNYGSRKNN